MYGAADGAAGDRVTWQGGAMTAFTTSPAYGYEQANAFNVLEAACSAVTGTRPTTWGTIKALYR